MGEGESLRSGGSPAAQGGSPRSGGERGAEESGQEAAGPRRRTIAERTTLAISIFLIVVLLSLVTRVWLSGGSDPPIVEARPLPAEMRQEGESYYLPVEVTNSGGVTAAEVMIHAELAGGDGAAEESEFTLDFLAGGETREGTVVFATDPLAGELTVDVASFQEG